MKVKNMMKVSLLLMMTLICCDAKPTWVHVDSIHIDGKLWAVRDVDGGFWEGNYTPNYMHAWVKQGDWILIQQHRGCGAYDLLEIKPSGATEGE